jgi:serine protease Do
MAKKKLITVMLFLYQLLAGCTSSPSPSSTTTPLDEASLSEKILTKSRQFTVKIFVGEGSGSGVIFKREKDVYYVLTTGHNFLLYSNTMNEDEAGIKSELDNSKSGDSANFSIVTVDGQLHKLMFSEVLPIPDVDISIFKFTSDKEYDVAKLSETFQPGQKIYLFGYKNCFQQQDKKVDEFDKTSEFTKGEIANIAKELPTKPREYEIGYTNASIVGMSGSPLLNDQGEVIAIHGFSGTNKSKTSEGTLQECGKLTSTFGGANGNWGIPVKKFLEKIKVVLKSKDGASVQ